MSKKDYIIRFHLTAYEDFKVEANNVEEAYEMVKSGEYANWHDDTGVLYGSENKFHVIYEVGEDGKWIDVIKEPLVKKLTVNPMPQAIATIKEYLNNVEIDGWENLHTDLDDLLEKVEDDIKIQENQSDE